MNQKLKSVAVAVGIAGIDYFEGIPALDFANQWRIGRSCHEEVQARLKAPSTTKWVSTLVKPIKDGRNHVVYGHLDSQNGFGAMIRSLYACEMRGLAAV